MSLSSIMKTQYPYNIQRIFSVVKISLDFFFFYFILLLFFFLIFKIFNQKTWDDDQKLIYSVYENR